MSTGNAAGVVVSPGVSQPSSEALSAQRVSLAPFTEAIRNVLGLWWYWTGDSEMPES